MFDICTHDLSALFWNRLLRLSAWQMDTVLGDVFAEGAKRELAREGMAYQTGSIPYSTAAWLGLLAVHIKPVRVIEIGTFIGKSTSALAIGMGGGTIYTCDASNETVMPSVIGDTRIKAHGKTSSTEMLRSLIPHPADTVTDPRADLFFFDGRVMPDDAHHIGQLSHERTVYAFDDFEGTEKGVANVSILRTPGLALITPPAEELLRPFGVADRSTLALLVPMTLFRFTAQ